MLQSQARSNGRRDDPLSLSVPMRLTLHPRLSRIVRALPQGGPLAWVEIALLALVAVQLARLFWAIATPVSPLGDWRPPQLAASTAAPGETG